MTRGRLEAFSDAVIAIAMTVMVLDLRTPAGTDWRALRPVVPTFLAYVLSFLFLAIYWNNHHHMLHLAERVNGAMLWANLHLLFWLSLTPFVTSWMGQTHCAPVPTAAYGVVLLLSAIAYMILQNVIIRLQGPGSKLKAAVGSDAKGKVSPLIYVLAIVLTPLSSWISVGLYALVALIWLIPDPRIESVANR